jgi:hypothetical protein
MKEDRPRPTVWCLNFASPIFRSPNVEFLPQFLQGDFMRRMPGLCFPKLFSFESRTNESLRRSVPDRCVRPWTSRRWIIAKAILAEAVVSLGDLRPVGHPGKPKLQSSPNPTRGPRQLNMSDLRPLITVST